MWRADGLGWWRGEAALEWLAPDGVEGRRSPLDVGERLAFTVGADRRCTGVWRAGRRIPCPTGARLAAGVRGGRCRECVALDRSSSVAADTLDDPRPFAVYLAHHGDVVKVGITAAERGDTRLLEQGALSSLRLSTGPLMAARRTERLLGTALGLPDRVPTHRKRAVRAAPGGPADRAAALDDTADRALALPGWPAAQRPAPATTVDHTPAYGLPPDGLVAGSVVAPFEPGHTVTGRVVCRVARDVYLAGPTGVVLLDTRLLSGWVLERPAPDAEFTARLHPAADRPPPPGLF